MTVAEKLTHIAENEQRVFDAGRKAEYDAFWDSFQNNGNPKDYSCTFGAGWTVESFRPKHAIVPTNAYMMFRGSTMEIDLAAHLDALGAKLDLSKAGNTQYLFQYAMFTRIGEVNLSGSTNTTPGDSTFSYCRKLKTIDKIILKTGSRGEFTSTAFINCDALENVTFEGLITSDVDIHWSTKLSENSIESLLNAAYNRPDPEVNPITVTLSKTAVDNAYRMPDGTDGSIGNKWVLGWEANRNFEIRLV